MRESINSGLLFDLAKLDAEITELTKKNNTEEQITQISSIIPLGRMAQPEEIAEFIYYLGSEKNTYITGQKIMIDGGYTIQ